MASAPDITSVEQAEKVLRHYGEMLARRERIRGHAFDRQLALLEDPCRLKAALCSRRAGKSMADGLGLIEAAMEAPDNNCLYIGLVRDSAREIMWDPILKRLNRELKLGAKSNETNLTLTFPNRSKIRLIGMDRDSDQLEKVLGPGYRRIVVDEAGSFRIDVESLVYKYLLPATSDRQGDIWLTGTPVAQRTEKNFFYRVTTGAVPGWAVHRWSTFDNPHMEVQWRQDIETLERERPEYRDTPEFRMMYLGEWFTDDSAIIYHFSAERNGVDLITRPLTSGVIGVDLGYNDPSAFVVAGWADNDTTLYIVWAEKRGEMLLSDVANTIQDLREKYPFAHTIVVDGAAKQAVEELRHRYSLPLLPTEKKGKADFQFMMDTDLRIGKIRVRSGACAPLIDEWCGLVWDKRAEERSGRRREHPGCPNHCADAALYAWRWARNFLEKSRPRAAPGVDDPGWAEAWVEKELARVAQEEADEREEREYGLL